MSYELTLSFTPIKGKKQVLDMLTKISDRIWKERESIIFSRRQDCPSLQAPENNKEADMQWIYNLMTSHVIYWKKYDLLAITGSARVRCKDLFPTTVTFQDKSDCDYAPEVYGNAIPLFNRLAGKAYCLTGHKALKIVRKYGDDSYSPEENEEDPWGIKREALYFLIEHKLRIKDFMAGEPSEKFQVFAINPIHCAKRWELCKNLLKSENKNLYG